MLYSKHHLLLTLVALFLFQFLNAQSGVKQYKTIEYMDDLTAYNNTLKQLEADVEYTIANMEKELIEKDLNIPVVFHILYNKNEERISVDEIKTQLEILNNDFATVIIPGSGQDQFKNTSHFNFCIPTLIPENLEASGVNYKQSSKIQWEGYNEIKSENIGRPPLNPQNYINIWVGNLGDDKKGYAQMPWGPQELDGIVIDYRYLSSEDNQNGATSGSHSLSHLVANYLGLYPLWGPAPCEDDHVEDTPIHNSPNTTCYTDNHVSTCDGNPAELTNNIMDSSSGDCIKGFTPGQIIRMQATLSLNGPRSQLLTNQITCQDLSGFQSKEMASTARSFDSTEDKAPKLTFEIIPNPFTDQFSIAIPPSLIEDVKSISIFSMNGKLALQKKSDFTDLMDFSNFPPGTYSITIATSNQEVSQNIVKQ